jgi:hypothetical protein
VGDFNADGIPDLAVANSGSNTVSILLGDGTGKFKVVETPAVGNNPQFVAVGDFNGDGKMDVATPNSNDSTVSVLLNDVPLAAPSPSSLAFEPQAVNTGSTPQPVTLTNAGVKTTKIFNITVASPDFSQTNNCSTSIPPGGQCTINVTFNPTKVGPLKGTIKIDDSSSNSPQTVSLTGAGTAVSLSPSSLTFGNQQPRTTSPPQVVTLTNYGQLAMAVHNIAISGGQAKNFAQTNNCGTSVPAGGSCSISVTFTPSSLGSQSSTLKVWDNGGSSPQSVPLSGTGGDWVELSPTSLAFGTLIIGTQSNPQPVTLTNTWVETLEISGIAIASPNFSQTNNCPSSLPPGGQCTINVTFNPAQVGNLKGTVNISDNAPNSPQTVPLTGNETEVTLSPSSLSFASQKVGTTSPPQIVTLTNLGQSPLLIQNIHFIGGQARNFGQTNNCGSSVPAQGSCSISVTFTPTEAGPKGAVLEVNDDGGASPQSVTVAGMGV